MMKGVWNYSFIEKRFLGGLILGVYELNVLFKMLLYYEE